MSIRNARVSNSRNIITYRKFAAIYLQKATTNKNLQNETASDCLGTNLPKSGSFRFAVTIA